MPAETNHRREVTAHRVRPAADKDSPPTARTIAVLEYLASVQDGSATPAEIVQRVGITRSTCRAILTALERSGYVTRDAEQRSYRIGPGSVALGRAARERDPLLRVVAGVFQQLNEELGVGCSLTARAGDQLLVVERIGAPNQFADAQHSGVRLPYAAPFGGPFAAFGDPAEIEEWLDRSGATVEERDGMRSMLDTIRRDGYFVQPISAGGQLGLMSVIDDIVRTGHLSTEKAHHAALLAHLVSGATPAARAAQTYPASTISFPIMGANGTPALAAVLQVVRDGLDPAGLDALGQRVKALMRSASAVVFE
jgi:DNA-binding IclR family transcriptional regulator